MRAWLIVIALGVSGCSGAGDECVRDDECGSDVCANTHHCVPPDQVRRIALTWTISGMAPDATACAGIDHLGVELEALGSDLKTDFEPVGCAAGSITFNKMLVDFDQLTLTAYGADRAVLASRTATLSGPEVTLQLDLAAVR